MKKLCRAIAAHVAAALVLVAVGFISLPNFVKTLILVLAGAFVFGITLTSNLP